MELFKLFGMIIINNSEANKEIDDTTDKAKNAEGKMSGAFEKIGGFAIKLGKAVVAGLGASAIAIGKLTSSAIESYAEYEQLVGGVETLFKDSSSKVIEYANNAYKTAGMSSNEYMETVTGFSASLLQSLKGDTAKATEYAHRAITDMSDNANKMGSDISMIQNAYGGFAKQNYTMLDNLKLGYGGTQEEMKRLIKDASKLKGVQKELGITVDANSMSFGNIVNAISVVQKNMGIMGTTSKEASTTIQGSVSAMKSAWQNLLTGLADDTQDFDALLKNFIDSALTVLGNLLPRIKIIFNGIPKLIDGLVPQIPGILQSLLPGLISGAVALLTGLMKILPEMGKMLITKIQEGLPTLMNLVTSFMGNIGTKIQENLPSIISKGLDMIEGLVDNIAQNLPILLTAGMDMLKNIVQGLMNALPELISRVPEIITKIANLINDNFPILLRKGFEILVTIANGIIQAIPTLIQSIPKIIQAIIAVWEAVQWVNLGKNLITGIGNGIKNLFNGFKDFVKNSFNNIKDVIKNIFTQTGTQSSSIWTNILNVIKNIVTKLGTSVKNIFSNLLGSVKNIFNNIKNAIQNPIESAKNFVKSALDKMKGFFNFTWQLPKIKLPHFRMSGSFSLNPPSVPSFGVDWYKKAYDNPMILNSPTLFGYSNGRFLGGGDGNGGEVIVGQNTLMNLFRSAVHEENSETSYMLQGLKNMLYDMLFEIISKLDRPIVLSDGTLISALAPGIDEALGEISDGKVRGR